MLLDTLPSYYKNIEKVEMKNNLLKSLKGIEQFRQVKELYIEDNLLSIEELHQLKKLRKLEILGVKGNPFTQDTNYRNKVTRILPNLKVLDGQKCGLEDEKVEEQGVAECFDNFINLIILQQFYYKTLVHQQLLRVHPLFSRQEHSTNVKVLLNNLKISSFDSLRGMFMKMIVNDIECVEEQVGNRRRAVEVFKQKQVDKIAEFKEVVDKKIREYQEQKRQRRVQINDELLDSSNRQSEQARNDVPIQSTSYYHQSSYKGQSQQQMGRQQTNVVNRQQTSGLQQQQMMSRYQSQNEQQLNRQKSPIEQQQLSRQQTSIISQQQSQPQPQQQQPQPQQQQQIGRQLTISQSQQLSKQQSQQLSKQQTQQLNKQQTQQLNRQQSQLNKQQSDKEQQQRGQQQSSSIQKLRYGVKEVIREKEREKLTKSIREVIVDKENQIEKLEKLLIEHQEQIEKMEKYIENEKEKGEQYQERLGIEEEEKEELNEKMEKMEKDKLRMEEKVRQMQLEMDDMRVRNYGLEKKGREWKDVEMKMYMMDRKIQDLNRYEQKREVVEQYCQKNVLKRGWNRLVDNMRAIKQARKQYCKNKQNKDRMVQWQVLRYWKGWSERQNIVNGLIKSKSKVMMKQYMMGWSRLIKNGRMIKEYQIRMARMRLAMYYKKLKEWVGWNRKEKELRRRVERGDDRRRMKIAMDGLLANWKIYGMNSNEWSRKRRMAEQYYMKRMQKIVVDGLKWYRWGYKQQWRQKMVKVDRYRQQWILQKVWGRLQDWRQKGYEDQYKAMVYMKRQQKLKVQKMLYVWKEEYHEYVVMEKKKQRWLIGYSMKRWLGYWKQYVLLQKRKRVRMEKVLMSSQMILMKRVMLGLGRNIVQKKRLEQRQQCVLDMVESRLKKKMVEQWKKEYGNIKREKDSEEQMKRMLVRKGLNYWLSYVQCKKKKRYMWRQAERQQQEQQGRYVGMVFKGWKRWGKQNRYNRQIVERQEQKRKMKLYVGFMGGLFRDIRERLQGELKNSKRDHQRIVYEQQQDGMENQQMKVEVRKMKEQIGQMVRQQKENERELDRRARKIEQIEQQIGQYKYQNQELGLMLQQNKDQHKYMESELGENQCELKRKTHHYEIMIETLKQKNLEVIKKVDGLVKKQMELEDELDQQKQSILIKEQNMDREREQMKEEVQLMESQMLQSEGRGLDKQTELERVWQKYHDKEQEIIKLENKVQMLQDQKEREEGMLMAKLYNLETQMEFIKSENKHLKEEKDQKRNEIYGLKQQMNKQYDYGYEDDDLKVFNDHKIAKDSNKLYDMPDRLEKSQYLSDRKEHSEYLNRTSDNIDENMMRLQTQRKQLKESIQNRINNLNRTMKQ